MKSSLPVLLAFFFFTSFTFSQTIQWEQLNGPFGGTPLSFVTTSNGDIFAGADQDQRGIFRSIDGGLTWQPKSAGLYLDNRAFSWLVIDDSSYIIAGTNSHIGSKVYKSKDNGESWSQIAVLGGTSVAQNDSGHIYVGNTGYGQYSVSKDAGYTWTHFTHTSPFINCIEINDSGHIFIGGNYTGYRSTDNGDSWTNLSLPDGINSFAFAPNGDVYAGCSREYASNSGVYKSTNNGDSWTPVKEGFRVYASHNIAINNDGDIFIGSYGWGIWRSTDDGTTWTSQNSGLHHFYIKSMYILSDGNIYAGATGGGIYRSTDNGESWQQVGVTSAQVRKITISPINENIFALVSGVSRSADNGQSWQPINNGINNLDIRTMNINSDGTIFCGVGNWDIGVVYRSTNNGNSWERSDNGLPDHDVSGLTFDDEGNVYVSIDYNGAYKSTDNGGTWFKIGDVPGGKLEFNSLGDLFLASYGGGFWKLPAGESTWVDLTANYGYNWIYSLFIGSNDYIYADQKRSTDNGITWTGTGINTGVAAFTENSKGHLFCATFNFGAGVLRSINYGDTWEQINSGIPTMDVRSVAVDSEDYLYAGPWGYSLFKTMTSTVTSIENEKQIPSSFYLEQNYPNPFNPNTVICYQLPVSGSVTLKVYDILGNEIATLVNEYKPAGSYQVEFNASELSSGIYFYQLTAGEFIQTNKMVLVR